MPGIAQHRRRGCVRGLTRWRRGQRCRGTSFQLASTADCRDRWVNGRSPPSISYREPQCRVTATCVDVRGGMNALARLRRVAVIDKINVECESKLAYFTAPSGAPRRRRRGSSAFENTLLAPPARRLPTLPRGCKDVYGGAALCVAPTEPEGDDCVAALKRRTKTNQDSLCLVVTVGDES